MRAHHTLFTRRSYSNHIKWQHQLHHNRRNSNRNCNQALWETASPFSVTHTTASCNCVPDSKGQQRVSIKPDIWLFIWVTALCGTFFLFFSGTLRISPPPHFNNRHELRHTLQASGGWDTACRHFPDSTTKSGSSDLTLLYCSNFSWE